MSDSSGYLETSRASQATGALPGLDVAPAWTRSPLSPSEHSKAGSPIAPRPAPLPSCPSKWIFAVPSPHSERTEPAMITDLEPTMASEQIRSQFADDPEFMELVRDYVAGLTPQIQRMVDLNQDGRWTEVAKLAHTLRGSGGMYGYDQLSESAGRVEDAIGSGTTGGAITLMVAALGRLVGRIQAGLDDSGAQPS